MVAVGRGEDIAADARKLDAHRYIDTNKENAADALNGMGGVKAILATAGNSAAIPAPMHALAPEGRLIVLSVGKDPLPVSTGYLVGAERGIIGSITGLPFENEKTLDFSVLTGVRPMIETMPLERAAEAVQKMRSGDAKFRIVLTMGDQSNAYQ
ncbi:Alcohol dehydrogenase (fragment) [Mesorhizobium sp. SOD10]